MNIVHRQLRVRTNDFVCSVPVAHQFEHKVHCNA